MKRMLIYGLLLLVATLALWHFVPPVVGGSIALLASIALAIRVRRYPNWQTLSFTFWIFAAVIAALMFPEPFRQWGSFELKRLIIPLLMVIMFGMGTTMNWHDFLGVLRMPTGVFVGLLCQFTIMPIVGFSLAYLFRFPPEIAAGIILVGCSPSGLASNVMSYIAGANVALSLTLTAVATILSPLLTPILMQLLAGELVEIPVYTMMFDIFKIVIIPIAAGLLFNQFLSGKFPVIDRTMPLVSMIGIAVIIAIITAVGRDKLLDVGLLLVMACLIHNVSGYFFGYQICRLLRMNQKDCRTIALEVGMQNSGLASGIAVTMNKVATMGLAAVVFGPLMNITGSSIAGYWKPKEGITKNEISNPV